MESPCCGISGSGGPSICPHVHFHLHRAFPLWLALAERRKDEDTLLCGPNLAMGGSRWVFFILGKIYDPGCLVVWELVWGYCSPDLLLGCFVHNLLYKNILFGRNLSLICAYSLAIVITVAMIHTYIKHFFLMLWCMWASVGSKLVSLALGWDFWYEGVLGHRYQSTGSDKYQILSQAVKEIPAYLWCSDISSYNTLCDG